MRSPATERSVTGRVRSRVAGLASVLLWLGLCAGLRAASIPEPDTIFYGRVLNFDHGHRLLVTEGKVEWTIRPEGDGGRSFHLSAPLELLADGSLSYRLKIPHEALVSGISASDLSAGTIPQTTADTRYGHYEIRVNGEQAHILAPGTDIFTVSAGRRASAHRMDIEISTPMADSDGSTLPDWWERLYFGRLGVDPLADPDRDGWNNRQEYLAGTDPTALNVSPVIAWDAPTLDEGATEIVTLRAIDSDTPSTNLVYTLTDVPHGVGIRALFALGRASNQARADDKVLKAGDTFTQAQVDSGSVVLIHEDPSKTAFTLGLSLSDGDATHGAYRTNFTVRIHKPTPDDGNGAAVWLDAREAAAGATGATISTWHDRSGAKPWLDGISNSFDGEAVSSALPLVNQGPLGQPVVGFNLTNAAGPQFLALPRPDRASVFHPGEVTVFAVINPTGRGPARQQVVNGANFQLAITGDEDHGRESQVRFASEGLGVVYGNHRIRDQWTLVSAWQDKRELAVELFGAWVGGPDPLDEATALGTDPVIGAKRTLGTASEPFQGCIAELLVFNRNLPGAERQRVNAALASKWFGWVILDGSEEERDVVRRVPSSGLSAEQYRTDFIPRFGPDRNYILIGGGGKDVLQGGQNHDVIVGGRQADIMTGGAGRDRFVFTYNNIHPGDDVITDFDPDREHDIIDLSDLFHGDSRDLRDYVRLRTDGHDSYLDIDYSGSGTYTNHTIVLSNTVLRDEDRYRLWADGDLLTGDKRFPLSASTVLIRDTARELDGDAARFDIRFTGGPAVPASLEMPFVLGGSAIRGADYLVEAQRYDEVGATYLWELVDGNELFVHLKPGDLAFGVRIIPIQNRRSDPARTVTFTLTPLPEIYDVSATPVTVQITDAPQEVRVAASAGQATPGGAGGVFLLSRNGSLDVPLDVTIRMTGPAANGTDYAYIPTVVRFEAGQSNAWVNVEAVLDENTRPARAAEMVLEPGEGYFVNPSGQSATVMILPSLPLISVEAYEPLAVGNPAMPGSFLFRRQGPSSGTLTVLFEVTGTAAMGRDYQRFNRWVVFNPGATLALVAVTPVDGVAISGIKTISVRLLPDAGFNVGGSGVAEVRLVSTGVTLGSWRSALFAPDSASVETFALRDFDGDGRPNLIEYAFGSDPRTPDTGTDGLPRPVMVDGHLGVRFVRPIAVVDVEYRIEVSTDLHNWRLANSEFDRVSSSTVGGGNEEVTYLNRMASPSSIGQFVRVRAQLR